MTVNGQSLNFSAFGDSNSLFAFENGGQFFNLTFSHPEAALTTSPSVNQLLASATLRLDSTTATADSNYQLITAAVPEPGAIALLMSLLTVLGLRKYRLRARNA